MCCTHYFYCWSITFTWHIFRKGCSVYFLPTFVVILARIFEEPATFVKHCTCTQKGFDLCVQNGQCWLIKLGFSPYFLPHQCNMTVDACFLYCRVPCLKAHICTVWCCTCLVFCLFVFLMFAFVADFNKNRHFSDPTNKKLAHILNSNDCLSVFWVFIRWEKHLSHLFPPDFLVIFTNLTRTSQSFKQQKP